MFLLKLCIIHFALLIRFLAVNSVLQPYYIWTHTVITIRKVLCTLTPHCQSFSNVKSLKGIKTIYLYHFYSQPLLSTATLQLYWLNSAKHSLFHQCWPGFLVIKLKITHYCANCMSVSHGERHYALTSGLSPSHYGPEIKQGRKSLQTLCGRRCLTLIQFERVFYWVQSRI